MNERKREYPMECLLFTRQWRPWWECFGEARGKCLHLAPKPKWYALFPLIQHTKLLHNKLLILNCVSLCAYMFILLCVYHIFIYNVNEFYCTWCLAVSIDFNYCEYTKWRTLHNAYNDQMKQAKWHWTSKWVMMLLILIYFYIFQFFYREICRIFRENAH